MESGWSPRSQCTQRERERERETVHGEWVAPKVSVCTQRERESDMFRQAFPDHQLPLSHTHTQSEVCRDDENTSNNHHLLVAIVLFRSDMYTPCFKCSSMEFARGWSYNKQEACPEYSVGGTHTKGEPERADVVWGPLSCDPELTSWYLLWYARP